VKSREPIKTAMIRHNEGMIRDLILMPDTQDATKHVLLVRQTKFNGDDGSVSSKRMTFTEEEMLMIANFWSTRHE